MLAGEKGSAASGARLLTIVVKELHALPADAVNVRRFIAHEAIGVGADVCDAGVITEDDKDVRLGRRRRCRHLHLCLCCLQRRAWGDCRPGERGASKQEATPVQLAVGRIALSWLKVRLRAAFVHLSAPLRIAASCRKAILLKRSSGTIREIPDRTGKPPVAGAWLSLNDVHHPPSSRRTHFRVRPVAVLSG